MAETLVETPGAVLRQSPNAGDVFDTIELPFYYLGLNTPLKRFMGAGGATVVLLYLIKPSGLWTKSGPRPWKLTSKDPTAVYIPWWAYGLAVGALAGIFI